MRFRKPRERTGIVGFLHEDGQIFSRNIPRIGCEFSNELFYGHVDMFVRNDISTLSQHLKACLPDAIQLRRFGTD
jgi:hypothetical protein